VVRHDTRAGQRSLGMMRWGLAPLWAKDIRVGFSNINAKAETIDTRPAFSQSLHWPTWLGERSADPEQLKSMLKPYPAEDMAIWPVDRRVGNVKNKDPSMIEPAAVAG
jgi:putative SOS response-associated peptidase YedK